MGRDPCQLNVDLVTIWEDKVRSLVRRGLFKLTKAPWEVVSATSIVTVWVRVTSTTTFWS